MTTVPEYCVSTSAGYPVAGPSSGTSTVIVSSSVSALPIITATPIAFGPSASGSVVGASTPSGVTGTIASTTLTANLPDYTGPATQSYASGGSYVADHGPTSSIAPANATTIASDSVTSTDTATASGSADTATGGGPLPPSASVTHASDGLLINSVTVPFAIGALIMATTFNFF